MVSTYGNSGVHLTGSLDRRTFFLSLKGLATVPLSLAWDIGLGHMREERPGLEPYKLEGPYAQFRDAHRRKHRTELCLSKTVSNGASLR